MAKSRYGSARQAEPTAPCGTPLHVATKIRYDTLVKHVSFHYLKYGKSFWTPLAGH